ncbi:uncharacterized protein LOC129266960 [Lytechinus pictus]|uniref:uncharacterized protein LOC129266960 n=1 Tax=Lytechinus pictus TaxID=7653 RepID=UPI0030B9B3D1
MQFPSKWMSCIGDILQKAGFDNDRQNDLIQYIVDCVDDIKVRHANAEALGTTLVQPYEVYKELYRIKPGKSSDPDGIPTRILKEYSGELATPLNFSRAFDRVDHTVLINKLISLEVRPWLVEWVKELTKVKLQGESPKKEIKFPNKLNDALSETRRLHVFDEHSFKHENADRFLKFKDEIYVIEHGNEYCRPITWTIDDDEAYIVFEYGFPLKLLEMTSALAPLCEKVEHITIDFDHDLDIQRHGSKPFIPMRSVLTVCLRSIFAQLRDSLWTVSKCFPNAKSLVLDCELALFESTSRHHSGIPLSSLRRLELHVPNKRDPDTLDNLFVLLCSSCQNIEFLTVTSYRTLKWKKSSTAITECKLNYLTDIHLQSHRSGEHYTFQLLADLLHVGPSLKFVKLESVQLGDVVLESVEWSRTSSDCGMQIKGATAAVPITDIIGLTTSDLKAVTVFTLVSCEIDFGQSGRKSPQSPKELGTLREIRFVGSENPLSESDRNKLSKLYPNVTVTTTVIQESQESYEESHEGAGIPSKLDKASFESLKTSAIVPDDGDVETTNKECCKRVGADGGRLRLESFGIELEIPPGAIDSNEPHEISLRALIHTPNLGDTKEEMSVCFGVQCLAPDDLLLRSPVTYTIPHCAVASRYSGLEAVLYTGEGKYSSHAVVKERKVLSRSGIPSCKIMKDVLELKMDHFSWAKIKIRITNFFFRGKRMCFWPFKQMNLPLAKTPVILHAHLLDDVKGNKEVEEKEKKLGFIPAHIDVLVLVQEAEVDLEMGCYVKNEQIGDTAVVAFCKLKSLTRICEDFELDLGNHPDIVAVSIKAGQTKKLEVKCLFELDFHIPQKLEKVSPLDSAIEHSASSSQTQQTSIQIREGTIEINPAREKDFDDILETVAEKFASRQEIHNLGKSLGFGPEDIDRFVEENMKETGVSYMGTLSMLRKWRKKQTKNTELKALQTALEKAGEIHLADVLFGE